MFAGRHKKTLVIDDVSVVIRKLSAKSLEKAAEAKRVAQMSLMKTLDRETMKAVQELQSVTASAPAEVVKVAPTPEQELEAKRQSRYDSYDRDSVLMAGIDSWDAVDDNGVTIEKNAGIEDLDEAAADTLFKSILDFSLPPLTKEEVEAAQGKS